MLDVPTSGGTLVRIQGSGFGADGVVKVGSATVPATSWADGVITFNAPPRTAGDASVTVIPTGSSVSAARTTALRYLGTVAGPAIASVASSTDLGHAARYQFDPQNDINGAFTVTGTNLDGSDPANTRVVVATDAGDPKTVVPTSVSGTSVTFNAPRDFAGGGWKWVTLVTDVGSSRFTRGMEYTGVGTSVTVSPTYGLCLRTSQDATGILTHEPATITINAAPDAFGASGTVTIDGTTIPTSSYTAGQVVIDMAGQGADLDSPWGGKTIVVTPDDTTKPAQRVGFTCGVSASVTTTVNGGASDVTVAAGTPFTLGHTTTGFIGPNPFTVPADGYEYVTKEQYDANGFTRDVVAGIPQAAGDYVIRVARGRATYAAERYVWPADATPVRVIITGTPITLTASSPRGASFTYRGQLISPDDIAYTASSTPDAVTAVEWEYRNSSCENDPQRLGGRPAQGCRHLADLLRW